MLVHPYRHNHNHHLVVRQVNLAVLERLFGYGVKILNLAGSSLTGLCDSISTLLKINDEIREGINLPKPHPTGPKVRGYAPRCNSAHVQLLFHVPT
jgi:hypothetical protein